jgi:hypothetical protein
MFACGTQDNGPNLVIAIERLEGICQVVDQVRIKKVVGRPLNLYFSDKILN